MKAQLDKTTVPNVIFLMIDMDTHHVFIEQSPVNRKSEINSVSYFIRFVPSMKEAQRLKSRFDKKPYLVQHYLKTL